MTRRELNGVRQLRNRIRQQEDYLHGLRGLIWSMENQLRQGQSNSVGKRVESLTLKIIDAEERLQWLLEQLDEAKADLRILITKETYDPLKRILILRYVGCWTWTEISKDTGLSRRTIYRLHKKFASQLDAH